MATPSNVTEHLKQLLDRLDTRSDEGYGRMSFRAKAVGKTKDSIHLAVETGIISVPLSEIAGLKSLSTRDPLVFRVDVLNGDKIIHLRKVPDSVHYPVPPGTGPDVGPFTWPPRFGPLGFPDVARLVGKDASTSTNTDDGIDTTCASGGEADQTDDHRSHNHGDTD